MSLLAKWRLWWGKKDMWSAVRAFGKSGVVMTQVVVDEDAVLVYSNFPEITEQLVKIVEPLAEREDMRVW